MTKIIGIAIAIFVAILLIYIVFKIAAKLAKLVFYLFSLIPIICSRIFYGIAKLLHIDGFIYHILSLFTIPSLLYLFLVHIPYSRKERLIKVKEAFVKARKERQLTIAMLFFYNVIAAGFFILYFYAPAEINKMTILVPGCAYAIFSLLYVFYKIYMWNEKYFYFYGRCMEWHKWQLQDSDSIANAELDERLISFCDDIYKNDNNKFKFTLDNIPYGRAMAFIAYFNRDFEDEDPIYFSPQMSNRDSEVDGCVCVSNRIIDTGNNFAKELREYGILITTRGMYISRPEEKDIELPFSGLFKIENNYGSYKIEYGLSYGEEKRHIIPCKDISIDLEVLNNSENFEDIPLILYHNGVKTDFDDEDFDSESYIRSRAEEAQNKFDKQQQFKDIQKATELGGLTEGLSRNANVIFTENKNYMNGKRGGGYAAEYGNNALDRLTRKDVKNVAQELENGRQKKNGADKCVNGVNIQTKYYMSASESIGAAFENKHAIYRNDDGTMMQIEVPRDQYEKAVQLMRKRILDGQVPKEKNPDNASKYVRKGWFTYSQANNIAIAGTVEGLSVDVAQGITCSLPGAGITAAMTFAKAVWDGKDLKEAAKACAFSSLKVIGKNTAAYVLTMQLSRDKIWNIFAPNEMCGPGNQIVKSVGFFNNPIAKTANDLAGGISSSALAKTGVGKAVGLDKMTGQKMIGGTITAAMMFGPDVLKAVQGNISGTQFLKNSAVNGAGLVGAAIGTAIPIPFVGTALGSAAGSFVAKKLLDNYIEDDMVAMYRILREEFLDIVMVFRFNKDESVYIIQTTLGRKDIQTILQNMFQSGQPKEYADAMINAVVQDVLSKRPKITRAMMEEGVKSLFEDKNVA